MSTLLRYFLLAALLLPLFSASQARCPAAMAASSYQAGREGHDQEGEEGHHHHKKQDTGDSTLPEVRSNLDHDDNDEDCQTCRDYYGEPWRSAERWIPWMKTKSWKIGIVALLCYMIMKGRYLYNFLRKKGKS